MLELPVRDGSTFRPIETGARRVRTDTNALVKPLIDGAGEVHPVP